MERKELEQIVSEAVRDADLSSREIPSIDLYVDQIISLVTEKQQEGSPRFHDRTLTKTMINNYSKDGLITPIRGKKYNKEQIVQMLTIFLLKGMLSIGEIKRVLDGAYEIEGFDGSDLTALYDRQLDVKACNRQHMMRMVDDVIEANGLDMEREEDYLILLAGMVSLSGFFKNVAQAMIDARYPEKPSVEDVENEEKERAKEKKKEEKKEKKEEKKKNKKANETEDVPTNSDQESEMGTKTV